MATCPQIKPILAEWLAMSNQSLTDWKRLPTALLQVFDFHIDSFSNHFWVKISDGNFWVPARLNPEVAQLFMSDHISNFDVVYILRSKGNPNIGSGDIELVSFYFKKNIV